MSTLNKTLIAIILGLVVTLGIFITINHNLNDKCDKWEHNYTVLQDSVKTIQTRYGEILYEKGSLILEKKELEKVLGISKKQIDDYEKNLNSKLSYISKLESQLSVKDTIKPTEIIHDTLSNSYTINYKDDWLYFNEKLTFNPSPVLDVYDINMNIPLKVGITDDYKIFVTSPNPYFNVTDIEGAVIDGSQFRKKEKKWFIGVYGGVGVHYGIISNKLDIGPHIGIGVGYKIFDF